MQISFVMRLKGSKGVTNVGVMSLRLGEEERKQIEELSESEKKDKSTVARELLRQGWIYHWLKLYRQGKASMGTVSKELDLSLSETLDLLAELGIDAPLDYDEYLEGYETLKKQT